MLKQKKKKKQQQLSSQLVCNWSACWVRKIYNIVAVWDFNERVPLSLEFLICVISAVVLFTWLARARARLALSRLIEVLKCKVCAYKRIQLIHWRATFSSTQFKHLHTFSIQLERFIIAALYHSLHDIIKRKRYRVRSQLNLITRSHKWMPVCFAHAETQFSQRKKNLEKIERIENTAITHHLNNYKLFMLENILREVKLLHQTTNTSFVKKETSNHKTDSVDSCK